MEEKTFSRLFKTYYAKLFRVAYSMLHDEDESHDAVHEVFATIWAKKIMVNPDTENEYLVRCVRNYCINQIVSKEREEKLRKLYPMELSLSQPSHIEEERLRQIETFIDEEMPEKTREVLRLCFGQEKSYAEAASTLQLSVAYVNKHIVKALRLLRERFNPNTKKND